MIIRNRRKLQIAYLSLQDTSSVRVARPLGLTVFDSVWLLTIWCENAEDFRHLRVDRITSLGDASQSFRHERGKQFSDALKNEKKS
mgnify:CR=1 FL=1